MVSRDDCEVSSSTAVTLRPVTTPADVEILRQIRNTCAPFMTRDTRMITPAAQVAWWRGLDRERVRCYLLESDGWVRGYGLLRLEEDRDWLSGGLWPSDRGRGWGRVLFRRLIMNARQSPWLEVRVDNRNARRLYENLGFESRGLIEAVLTMALPEALWKEFRVC